MQGREKRGREREIKEEKEEEKPFHILPTRHTNTQEQSEFFLHFVQQNAPLSFRSSLFV